MFNNDKNNDYDDDKVHVYRNVKARSVKERRDIYI